MVGNGCNISCPRCHPKAPRRVCRFASVFDRALSSSLPNRHKKRLKMFELVVVICLCMCSCMFLYRDMKFNKMNEMNGFRMNLFESFLVQNSNGFRWIWRLKCRMSSIAALLLSPQILTGESAGENNGKQSDMRCI